VRVGDLFIPEHDGPCTESETNRQCYFDDEMGGCNCPAIESRVGELWVPWYSGQCQQPELDRGCYYDEIFTARCVCPGTESRVGSQVKKEVRVGVAYDPYYYGQCQQPELDRGCYYDAIYTARCVCPRTESRVGTGKEFTEARVGASYDPWYYGHCQQPELDRGCFYDELYTAHCMCPRAESRVGLQANTFEVFGFSNHVFINLFAIIGAMTLVYHATNFVHTKFVSRDFTRIEEEC